MYTINAYQPLQNISFVESPSTQNTELATICRQYPVAIPVSVAAKFLGMSKECLRAAIDQNRCPFGLSWKQGTRAGYKIPTIAFHSWLTKGTVPLANYHNSGGNQRWHPANRGLSLR